VRGCSRPCTPSTAGSFGSRAARPFAPWPAPAMYSQEGQTDFGESAGVDVDGRKNQFVQEGSGLSQGAGQYPQSSMASWQYGADGYGGYGQYGGYGGYGNYGMYPGMYQLYGGYGMYPGAGYYPQAGMGYQGRIGADGVDGRDCGRDGRPGMRATSNQQMMPGDWLCPRCGDHVFARNPACRRCATPKPEGAGAGGGASFASSGLPVRPAATNNQRALPGDWYCPRCKDLQFARNMQCRMCGAGKPEAGGFDLRDERPLGGSRYRRSRTRSRSRSRRRRSRSR